MRDYKITAPGVATPAAPPTPDEMLVHSERAGVWIPLAQNFAGGILGVGSVTTITLWKLFNVEPAAALEAALFSGLVVFGLATMVRMFRDEIRFMVAAWGERQDRATRAALQAHNDELQTVVAELRNRDLLDHRYSAMLTVERLLGDRYDRGLDITRTACLGRGMTRAAWDDAMEMLRGAGVVDGQGKLKMATKPDAWSAVMRSQYAGLGTYVRAADNDLVKIK